MKIGIAGAGGRMGQALLDAFSNSGSASSLVMASASPGREAAARTALAKTGLSPSLTSDPAALVAACDAVIDFTSPAGTVAIARAMCEAAGEKIHIIGTTGLSESEQREIARAAEKTRVVQSANFSLGVNMLAALVERAATLLDESYDIEVDEMHHRLKKDSPSGTALLLAEAAAKGRGISLAAARRHYGEGNIGAREPGTIGISARRGGEVVGVHTVTLAGPGENLELTHRAHSRAIYAHGALRAAHWAAGQRPGLYSMRDVLGL